MQDLRNYGFEDAAEIYPSQGRGFCQEIAVGKKGVGNVLSSLELLNPDKESEMAVIYTGSDTVMKIIS